MGVKHASRAVGDQPDAGEMVAVEIADRRPRPTRIGDPEIGVRLQDDPLISPLPKPPDFRNPRVERLPRPHRFRLPRAIGAVGVGGRQPSKQHRGRAVGVVVGDDLVAKPHGHIAVGVIGIGLVGNLSRFQEDSIQDS